MSGGSYNYVYSRVNDMADQIEEHERQPVDPDWVREPRVYDHVNKRLLSIEESAPILARVTSDRVWFAEHLRVIANAMHAVEWVDSGDYGPGDEVAAIVAVREHAAKGAP